MTLLKFPRTFHVQGSRFQNGDHDLEAIPWSELRGKHLVIEEKMDGSNCGISFDEQGNLLLQSRGHYLRGGPREKQFDVLKQWAGTHREELFHVLGRRYIIYAEWLAAKHTLFYDALPHYFMEFDILDKQDNVFLGTNARKRALNGTAKQNPSTDGSLWEPNTLITSVKILTEGKFQKISDLEAMITRSNFVTEEHRENLIKAARAAGVSSDDAIKSTDMNTVMEGLYIKWEENNEVLGRYKYVRESFTNSILDQGDHWLNRPIINNKLIDGSYERMFE